VKVAVHRAKAGNASSSDKDSSIAGARPIALSDSARKLLLARVRLLESAA
jgi:hypothetical protein